MSCEQGRQRKIVRTASLEEEHWSADWGGAFQGAEPTHINAFALVSLENTCALPLALKVCRNSTGEDRGCQNAAAALCSDGGRAACKALGGHGCTLIMAMRCR